MQVSSRSRRAIHLIVQRAFMIELTHGCFYVVGIPADGRARSIGEEKTFPGADYLCPRSMSAAPGGHDWHAVSTPA